MSGRPTKLDADVARKIVEFIRAGSHAEPAAAACGIHRVTLYRWMKRGERQSRGIYRDFYDAVMRAEAESELRHLMLISKAAPTDWRASAWLLERRWPNRYGLQITLGLKKGFSEMLEALKGRVPEEMFVQVLSALSGLGQPELADPDMGQIVLANAEKAPEASGSEDEGQSQT